MPRRVHLEFTVPTASSYPAVGENIVTTRAIASTVPIANANLTTWEIVSRRVHLASTVTIASANPPVWKNRVETSALKLYFWNS